MNTFFVNILFFHYWQNVFCGPSEIASQVGFGLRGVVWRTLIKPMKRCGDSTHRSETRGGKGAQFPGRRITMRAPNDCNDTNNEFFGFISRSETTRIALFLFSDSCFSAAKISLLTLAVASLDNHLVLHAPCNCRPFVFIVVWCSARHTDRKGETVKHFHNWIKILSQFRTPYYTNLRQYSKRRKWGGAHDNAQMLYLQFSLPTSAPEIVSAYNTAAACCNVFFKSFYFDTRQNLDSVPEFRVSLQNCRVSFWHWF